MTLLLILAGVIGSALAQDGIEAQTTTSDTLNLRKGPGVAYGVVVELQPGTEITLLERALGNWARVREPGGQEGWLNAYYVTFPEGVTIYDVPLANIGEFSENEDIQASIVSHLNMRGGPGTQYPVIATLSPGTVIDVDARDASSFWVLGRTGEKRGWVAVGYLQFDRIVGAELPISSEILEVPEGEIDQIEAPADSEPPAQPAGPSGGSSDISAIPTVSAAMQAVFQKGQQLGNRADVFTKVGDCITANWMFLNPIGTGDHKPSAYPGLEDIIAYYSEAELRGGLNSFSNQSLAMHDGITSAQILDHTWANPNLCKSGETPLACEYRINKPSIAIIMLGTTDVYSSFAEQFKENVDKIIEISLDHGVIPLVSTAPGYRTGAKYESHAIHFNTLLVESAKAHNVPIMDLYGALLSMPEDERFKEGTESHLSADGYYVRNLLTLKALRAIKEAVMR
jgi:uncharacterized protein YraI